MSDPVFQKLKTDAGIVLVDLWRALRHENPAEEWRHPRQGETAPPQGAKKLPEPARSSGLCYFHLN